MNALQRLRGGNNTLRTGSMDGRSIGGHDAADHPAVERRASDDSALLITRSNASSPIAKQVSPVASVSRDAGRKRRDGAGDIGDASSSGTFEPTTAVDNDNDNEDCNSSDLDVRFGGLVQQLARNVRDLSLRLIGSDINDQGKERLESFNESVEQLMTLIQEKLNGSSSSAKDEKLKELFGESSAALKTHSAAFAKEVQRQSAEEGTVALRAAQELLASTASSLIRQGRDFAEFIKSRNERLKTSVLNQCKQLIVSLKKLREAASSSSSQPDGGVTPEQFSNACSAVSQQLSVFFRIAEAVVLDSDAQLLRSACSNVTECAKRAREASELTAELRSAAAPVSDDDMSAASTSSAAADTALQEELTLAVNSIRKVMYGVLSMQGADSGSAHSEALRSRYAIRLDAERQEQMMQQKTIVDRDADYRREACSSNLTECAAILEKNQAAVGFYAKHFFTPLSAAASIRRSSAVLPTTSGANSLASSAKSTKSAEEEESAVSSSSSSSTTPPPSASPTSPASSEPRPQVSFVCNAEHCGGPSLSIISVLRQGMTVKGFAKPQHVALIRSKSGDELIYLESTSNASSSSASPSVSLAKDKDLIKALKNGKPWLAKADIRVLCEAGGDLAQQLINELSQFESKNMMRSFKFGVLLLAAETPAADEDALYTHQGSHFETEEFLSIIGEKIRLKGWSKYRGGLDVKTDTTGEHTYYASHSGLEICFHVPFLMPFKANDPQQVERKRHCGNDIVIIVFRDRDAPAFDPACIRSHFNHIFLVVTPCHRLGEEPHYRLDLISQRAIGTFGPSLYDAPIYAAGDVLKNFVLTKLINGERAALTSPAFKDKVAYARQAMLEAIVNEYPAKSVGSRINFFKRIGSSGRRKKT